MPGPSSDEGTPDAWQQHVSALAAQGIAELGSVRDQHPRRPATDADVQSLYDVGPSFADLLPWVEYLPASQSLLLDDGVSVGAFFDVSPIATEGREPTWLWQARDALEAALQDSLDELDDHPWVVQIYAQDESHFDDELRALADYVQPSAQGTAFTELYLRTMAHHLRAIAKPGGLFDDLAVTRRPWRGQTRRVRMVVYRRAPASTRSRRGPSPEQALTTICDRLTGALAHAGVKTRRMDAGSIYDWLLRWFNPHPTLLGSDEADRERFYALTRYPTSTPEGELELAADDFAQRLFFTQPRSDVQSGTWRFDGLPHRVVVMDRLRTPPSTGHVTGEMRRSGDAINALFDELPEGTVMCLTIVATPQDVLEGHLNQLAKKAVGDTLASEQTRKDVHEARSLIGNAHKLYRGAVAFYLHGHDVAQLDERSRQLANAMLNAGLQPVRDEDEVAPLNSYLRWLPCVFDPSADKHHWYTQLMWVQHLVNLAPVWGRARGTDHPGITFFNRGGEPLHFDPFRDRQMNAHLCFFGPTGSGKSATVNAILNQVMAIYRPRIVICEVGNSFGLFGEFAQRLGLTVNRVTLAPGAGVSLAPFAEAHRLIETPSRVRTLDADALDDELDAAVQAASHNEHRDVLGELEITARLMVTGGEEREEARMTRADRSLLRQCILDAAQRCVAEQRTVLTHDVRDAIRERSRDKELPESRRARLAEMAEAIDLFCQGADGQMFDTPGTPWPEADITIVDLATFAREGYGAQLAVSYISLINAVNNIAERDQCLGRHLICLTDEAHIITKNPLLSPFLVKVVKMWRKLGAWLWLATQNLADLPNAAEAVLNMVEWWICLSMPPDEVEQVARFRELTTAQKALIRSARKESRKYAEGVILSKSVEALFRAVPPSLYLALSQTEAEEKAARYRLMRQHGLSELDAAMRVAEETDRARGIEPLRWQDAA